MKWINSLICLVRPKANEAYLHIILYTHMYIVYFYRKKATTYTNELRANKMKHIQYILVNSRCLREYHKTMKCTLSLSLSVCLWSSSHLRIEWNAKIQIQIFLFLSSRKCFDGKWLEASVVMLLITMHRIKIILKVNTSNYRVYEFFMFFFLLCKSFFYHA